MLSSKQTSVSLFHTDSRVTVVYFVLFIVTNSILSYFPLGLSTKIWIGFMGWGLPFLAACWEAFQISPSPFPSREEFWKTPKLWICSTLLSATLGTHLYILFSSTWPVPDDGLTPFFALELLRKWNWTFFFTITQSPPLSVWLLALFFKFFHPSIFSIRLFPALFYLLPLPFGYAAVKKFFSPSTSFLFLVLLCLSFWPLYSSRFCMFMDCLFALEIMSFWALSLCINSWGKKESSKHQILLGFMIGIGLWVFVAWPLAAFILILPVLDLVRKQTSKIPMGPLLRLGVPVLLFLVPLLFFSINEKNGEHVKFLLGLRPGEDWLERLQDAFSNFTALFWGCDLRKNAYGPVFGGILTPVEGALFFLGILELIRSRSSGFSRWIFGALFLFMLPGVITHSFEIFRNFLALPFLLLVVSLGAQNLATNLPTQRRGLILGALIVFSLLLSSIHLIKSFGLEGQTLEAENFSQNRTFSKAFEILKHTADQSGPGLILLDLQPNQDNQTLNLAAYDFNAARNPRFSPSQAKWLAVMVNANYEYFLARRFPRAEWYGLGPDLFWNEGGLLLGIIPLEANRNPFAQDWLEMDRGLHSITVQTFFDHSQTHEPEIYRNLLQLDPPSGTDPFLISIFCEKACFYKRFSSEPGDFLPWIQKAVRYGYPAAHFFTAEGFVLSSAGRAAEARLAFERAVQSPMNMTNAAEILKSMERSKKAPLPASR